MVTRSTGITECCFISLTFFIEIMDWIHLSRDRDQRRALMNMVMKLPGLEKRDYGRRGSAALTTRHPSIRKSWH
jgi:hypothetical protein